MNSVEQVVTKTDDTMHNPAHEVDIAQALEVHEATEAENESDGSDEGEETERVSNIREHHLKSIVESLVFASPKPITAGQVAKVVGVKLAEAKQILESLQRDYVGRGIEVAEVSGGFQFRTAAACAPFLRDFVGLKPVRLTRAQLETLALVAYRQPITRPEIDDTRGVDSGSALKVLLERGLLRILGRKEEAGRPLLYGTTTQFLEFFGLAALRDLPTLREFSDLTDESRALFERKMGEPASAYVPSSDPPAADESAEFSAVSNTEVQSEEEEVQMGTMDVEESGMPEEQLEAVEDREAELHMAGGDDEEDEDFDDDDDDFEDEDDDEDDDEDYDDEDDDDDFEDEEEDDD